MKKRLLKLTCLIMLLTGSVYAQKVTGKVTSETDGTPMPGVSILLKGTSTGTATDSDGSYTLNVSDLSNGTLVFSFIGFVTKEVPTQGRSVVDVALAEDATQLSEVVVTALGISREAKTLTYATQTVKASQLVEVRDANNMLNSLSGKVANIQINQGSGGVGSGARVVMRGNRSIQQSNNALIVVDGVPITNNTNGAAGSDFGSVQGSDGASNINPDDIESLTVLRGASAAALYGSQAGNGVILITTKKGKAGAISVNINSGITTEKAFSLPALQNEYGQGVGGVLNSSQGASWGAQMTGQSFTGHMGESRPYSAQADNVKDFFRTGVSLNNSIGVSGGSDKMQTYLSYTNNKIQGIVPKNDMNRHTINLRISNQVSKKFSIDSKVTYISQEIKNRPRTGEENAPVSNIFQIPRNVSIEDAQNSDAVNNIGVSVPTTWPSTQASIYQNPYWMINRTAINEDRDRIMGFLSAKYDITDWLNIKGRANIDKLSDQGEEWYSQGTILYAPNGGTYNTSKINTTQQWYDLMLEGKNTLTSDFKIDYRVGTIFYDTRTDWLNNNANGLNVTNKFSLNFASAPSVGQNSSQIQTQSLFGQFTLAFKESIFIDGSLRNDWDSRLPSPYSFSYPSIGVSAIISDLVELPSAISFLKLNSSYSVVGNGGAAQVRLNTYGYQQGAGNGFIQRSPTLAIPDLKPELVKNLEFGFDSKFIDNKLGISFTYYKSNSTNQLLSLSLPPASGFSTQYFNAGNIQNTGIEVVINATPMKTSSLTWDIAFNLGSNKNKIIELSKDVKIFFLGGGFGRSATPVVKEGGSYGDLVAFKWLTDASGNYQVNAAGLPRETIAQEFIGSFNPKAILGLTNTLTYGDFTLRALVDGRVGGIIVSGSEMNMAFNGTPEITATNRKVEDGWKLNSSAPTITSQQFWQTVSGGRYGWGEFFAYDATNFRLRELSLGYNIPVPSSISVKARLAVVARNLFFLYRGSSILDIPGLPKRKMSFDPDMALGNGNYQGIQYYTLPSTRSLGVNLQLTF